MLFVLPLVAAGVALVNYYGAKESIRPEMVVSMLPLSFMEGLTDWEAVSGGLLLLLLLAYLLFFLNARYKFLSQLTALPSFLFILLTAGLVPAYGLSDLLVALLLAVIGFAGLQSAILDSKSNGSVFNFGFFVCGAVLVYPKLLLLMAWSLCVLFFSGRSTLKDVVALLLGWGTALFFALFYYFWTGQLSEFLPVFRNVFLTGEYNWALLRQEWIRMGIFTVLLLISLIRIIGYYPVSVVNQRRGITSLMSLLVFLGLTLFIVPGVQLNFMYVLAWPLAYLYAQYFILYRVRLLGDIFFLSLLLSCFLPFFL